MKYWMLVASKNHVQRGIEGGFAQACHGKATPLKCMEIGDGVIYYSSKLVFEEENLCQEFTAIGSVAGQEVYPFDMGNGFVPYRRDIKYFTQAHDVAIKPLINDLEFIKDKQKWGYQFRFGAFEIPKHDYDLIAHEMGVKP